jgi:transposase
LDWKPGRFRNGYSSLSPKPSYQICVETRHMQAVLKAQIPVHVKMLRSQKLRMLLTHRKPLQKAIAIENALRGTLRNFGLKVGVVGTVRFEARIRELVSLTWRRSFLRVLSATPNDYRARFSY